MKLVVASYNIHGCVGSDGRLDAQRTVGVIREVAPDVVALQEVYTRAGASGDFLAALAEATGMRAVAGPTLVRERGHYGNVLLTRLPLRAVRRLDLSLVDREPRGALDVDLDAGGVALRVVATHLGLHPWERRFQIRHLLAELAARKTYPVALLGDINEWFAWGRPLQWLHAHFGRPPAPATFPARLPLLALDRVWLLPRRCLSGVRAHRSPLARQASDHLPLVAEVEVEL